MKGIKKIVVSCACIILTMGTICAWAASEDTEEIKNGVTIENVDVSGMTAAEAKKAIKSIADERLATKINVEINGKTLETTLKSLGYKWNNTSVIDDAVNAGKTGNIIKRYKDSLDLQHNGMEYQLEIGVEKDTLEAKLKNKCEKYEVKAQNASLEATGSGFKIIPEQEGVAVDYDKTVEDLFTYVSEQWDKKADIQLTATTTVSKPQYTEEDCRKVSNEPMGSYTTEFTVGSAYANRNMNIENGAVLINGAVVYPGEQYSCNEHLEPWTEDNGWHPAGTYVDGGVQDSLGGGICQVSSTLYNALLKAEIKVVKRFPHSMAVGYVPLSADAALAGDYKDLVFENDTDAPIYVQGIYNSSGSITFNIYGHDTRGASHSVKYESKTIKTTPIKQKIKKDATKPTSYKETESAGHVGYVAELWKITYENGKEVSRERIHTSTYAMSPEIIVKGTKKESSKDKDKDKDKKDKDSEETTKKKNEKETKKKESETTKKSE